jgi:hypothetical protein
MPKSKADKHLDKFLRSHNPAEMLRELRHAPHFGHTESSGSSHVNVYDDKGQFVTAIPMHKYLPKGTEHAIKKAVMKAGLFMALVAFILIVMALILLFAI